MPQFVRYQSAVPNRHGRFPGVFALANGLRDDGLLDADDQLWLLEANQEAIETYVDPSIVYAACYDSTVNPGARAWFVADAADLLAMTALYLQLLDRYEVPWMQQRASQGASSIKTLRRSSPCPIGTPRTGPSPDVSAADHSPDTFAEACNDQQLVGHGRLKAWGG